MIDLESLQNLMLFDLLNSKVYKNSKEFFFCALYDLPNFRGYFERFITKDIKKIMMHGKTRLITHFFQSGQGYFLELGFIFNL